jgi:hypothetical protein
MNRQREKLVLTNEEGRSLVWRENKDFETIEDTIIENTRWSIVHEIIVKRLSDGKYFMDNYSVGATETQDESAYEYSDPEFVEVFPVEKTIITYE